MEKLIPVTLKNGRTINVLPREIEGLRLAGKLAEGQEIIETPDETQEVITKDTPVKKPPKKRPLNITKDSFKQGKKA